MMRPVFGAVAGVYLVLSFTACSLSKPAVIKPAVTFVGVTLSKGIQEHGDMAVAQAPANTFLTTDKEVVAIVNFENLHGIVRLRWDWFGPKGKLYVSKEAKTVQSAEGKYFKTFSAWHILTIKGDRAAKMPGEWNVKVYLNNELLDYKTFTLLTPRK